VAWLQGRHVDTSVTQSVDSPIPNSVPVEPTFRPAWRYPAQLEPLPVDITSPPPVSSVPPNVTPVPSLYLRPVSFIPYYDRPTLDTSVTQSVDSPPGFTIQEPREGAQSLIPWLQRGPGLISSPDNPNAPTFQVYARQVAEWQAYQKFPSAVFTASVDSPPLHGLYPMAPYRRPVPPTPYRLPPTGVLVAPPILPAPILGSILTTQAIVDGRTVTVAIIDGQTYTVEILDGRTSTE
jgi:hypothetical protein